MGTALKVRFANRVDFLSAQDALTPGRLAATVIEHLLGTLRGLQSLTNTAPSFTITSQSSWFHPGLKARKL